MVDPMEFEIDEPEKVVYVVGIGPGDVYYLTQEAQNVLEHADAICGYKLYLDLIEPEFPCEEYYSTGMTSTALAMSSCAPISRKKNITPPA